MSINLKSFPHILGQGSKVMKERDFTRLLLGFKARQDRHRVQAHLERFSLVLENDDLRKSEKVNHTPRRFWVRSRNAELIEQPHVSALKESLQSELEWIGPVYRVVGREGRRGLVCPLPNVLIIKPRVGINQADLDELLRQLQEVPEKSRYGRGYRYYVLKDPQQHTVFPIQKNLAAKRELIERSGYEEMWFLSPAALVPHDPYYAANGQYPGQWNMKQIQLEAGYDISKGGSITVLVCVLDSGCDLYHPDLAHAFQTTKGINIGDPSFDGSADSSDAHGTACTGIIAAKYDNGIGIAGLADQCQIMPLKFEGASQDQLFRAINYAADNGARMISLSSSDDNWSLPAVDDNGQTIYWETLIDNAISEACTSTASRPGLVVCVSTNNKDQRHIPYPATHPMVMACGASNQFDMRKASNAPPDGECWGSNFGDEMSVVAPGVLIPTTDNTVNGYNNNGGGAIRDWSCKDYTYSGDPKGEYFFLFNGTSAATPHVAGLAALLISTYPSLTNVQVRDIIERTAERINDKADPVMPGIYEYREDLATHRNGRWNEEVGYGRINVYQALNFADVMIRDYPGDEGAEPSSPPGGNFWDASDIVIRPNDDGVFIPDNVDESGFMRRLRDNFVYVRVTNNGPADATNIMVRAWIPYWNWHSIVTQTTTYDFPSLQLTPISAAFPLVTAGDYVTAKFKITKDQIDVISQAGGKMPYWKSWMFGYLSSIRAEVKADNDYAYAGYVNSGSNTGADLIIRRNNLAERNFSMIDEFPPIDFKVIETHPRQWMDPFIEKIRALVHR